MSLINDAIRQLEGAPLAARSNLPRATVKSPPAQNRKALMVGGTCVALGLLSTAWLLLPSFAVKPWAQQTVSPVLETPLATASLPAPVVPQGLQEPAGANKTPQLEAMSETYRPPVQPTAPVAEREQKVAASLPKAVVMASSTLQSKPLKQPKPVQQEQASVQAPEPSVSLEQRLSLFLSAMKSNEIDAAKVQLTAVQELLVPGALTRLRAEAWFALRSGNAALANQTYRHILERVPGDEEASLNLASLEAQANRGEWVGQVLADGLRGNPDSTALREALGRFNAVGRH